jgi:flagellar biosynthesis/type III secretory pathway M-ring protein FliF/YscJ
VYFSIFLIYSFFYYLLFIIIHIIYYLYFSEFSRETETLLESFIQDEFSTQQPIEEQKFELVINRLSNAVHLSRGISACLSRVYLLLFFL